MRSTVSVGWAGQRFSSAGIFNMTSSWLGTCEWLPTPRTPTGGATREGGTNSLSRPFATLDVNKGGGADALESWRHEQEHRRSTRIIWWLRRNGTDGDRRNDRFAGVEPDLWSGFRRRKLRRYPEPAVVGRRSGAAVRSIAGRTARGAVR